LAAPERHEQLVATRTPEAGQRQALELAIEAPLRRPRPLAAERGLLTSGTQRPRSVGENGALATPRRKRAARTDVDVECRQLTACPRDVRSADSDEGVLALRRRQVCGQERQPQRLLGIGLGGDVREHARGVALELLEARGRERQLVGESLGVGGGLQASHQLAAIAVVGGLLDAMNAHRSLRSARRGRRPAPTRRARARRSPRRGRLGRATDRTVGQEAVVAAEGRHRK